MQNESDAPTLDIPIPEEDQSRKSDHEKSVRSEERRIHKVCVEDRVAYARLQSHARHGQSGSASQVGVCDTFLHSRDDR